MFGFLGLLVVAFAIMFERIIFAISVLMIVLWLHRRWLTVRSRWLQRSASLRSALSHAATSWMRNVRRAFGSTVRV